MPHIVSSNVAGEGTLNARSYPTIIRIESAPNSDSEAREIAQGLRAQGFKVIHTDVCCIKRLFTAAPQDMFTRSYRVEA